MAPCPSAEYVAESLSLSRVVLVLALTAVSLPRSHTGIARCTSEEDVYEGYTIPKGTIVMPNIWYVGPGLLGPRSYSLTQILSRAIAFSKLGPYDPQDFVPERFLEKTEEAPIDPTTSWAFGFARR